MASKRQGPRQPLSQRRPKVALRKGTLKNTAVPKRATPLPPSPSRRPAKPNVTSGATVKPGVKAGRKAKPGAAGPTTKQAAKPGAARRRASTRVAPDPALLYDRLVALYPDAHCELDFATPFQLLVATILSAQCTDKRVNMVTPALFARYPTAESLAAARQEDVEEIIKSTGFFRNKAKSIIGMAGAVAGTYGGEVPAAMGALVALPGVGRKTANVILGNAFGVNEGVVVDTHVGRLAVRLGLTNETDPVKVEQRLMQLFPVERWTMLSHLLIFHGRRVCDAKAPRCGTCTLADVCPSRRLDA